MDNYRIGLLSFFCLVLIASCIDPPYPDQLILQHIPTVAALALLVLSPRFLSLDRTSFTLIVAFLFLHVVGARYIYSYVPYDEWSRALLGVTISEVFDLRRNDYDRLVHFGYGLLLVRPAHNILMRYVRTSRRVGYYLALEVIMATSMVYELAEWGVALALAPQDAEFYNGQQGDMWDAQKDMALATLGALVGIGIMAVRRRRESGGGREE